MSLDEIAEEVGEVTEERDKEKDNKWAIEVDAFDLKEYMKSLEEYEGGWGTE